MAYKLLKPYTEEQRINFIVQYNHNMGMEIGETTTALCALEPWETIENDIIVDHKEEYDKEQFELAKSDKLQENTAKAKEAVDKGYVVFKEAEFETNSQTVGDLTATMLMMQAGGIESYDWLSKDDKVVTLTLEDFASLGVLIANYKNTVWSVKYIGFKQQIEEATTIEEIKAIVIDYDVPELLLLLANQTTEEGE